MNKQVKQALYIVVGAGLGALIRWTCINWIPNATIWAGIVAGAYIGYKKSN